ncbi:peptidoglycan-binding protein [Luteibacter anthropi]|nr:peptidoglycan-binding protein [Luteibacter anthropi]
MDLAEGRSSQLHNGDHDGVLRRGDRGDAVGALQASLTALGYKDSNGHQLQADKDFGANTYHAVKTFQHDHGLQEDGIAGRATLGAITEAVARQKVPSMMDTGHPAKGMYDQAFQCVAQLDKNHHRETGPHSQMLSGSLVTAATAAGFQRIDHVILSDDASRAYAVQGDLKSPFKQYADVDVMKAIQTPLSQSSEEAVANIRANEHAEMQKGQQQPAQQQASDIQQQSTILQR